MTAPRGHRFGISHLLTGCPGSGGGVLLLGILTVFVTLSVAVEGRPESGAPMGIRRMRGRETK